MATATIKHEITLQLSWDEATTLKCILQYVGGSPNGRRGFINNIADALISVGVDHKVAEQDFNRGSSGDIIFKDTISVVKQ